MDALEKTSNMPVILIDEPSLNLDRNCAYQDMPREKNLRGMLRSAVDRAVSRDTIVIVDSLNNIKGYRYELWCLARASATLYCVMKHNVEHGTKTDERRRCLNTKRRCSKGLMEKIDGILASLNFILAKVLAGLNAADSLYAVDRIKVVEILRVLGTLKCCNPLLLHRILQARTSETNSLYELDRATQEVMSILVDAQAQGMSGVVRSVYLGEGISIINLQRNVGLPELRRLRRTFLKLAGQSSLSGPPPSDAKSAKCMFADYLNRELSANMLE